MVDSSYQAMYCFAAMLPELEGFHREHLPHMTGSPLSVAASSHWDCGPIACARDRSTRPT